MNVHSHGVPIIVAEDDADDRLLIADAFEENGVSNDIIFVENGEELLSLLRCEDRSAALQVALPPAIILLDLNMPRMGGHEALRHIRDDGTLSSTPVIIFSTSRADEDVEKAYQLGANSFVAKPRSFDGLINHVKVIHDYWLKGLNIRPDGTRHAMPQTSTRSGPDAEDDGDRIGTDRQALARCPTNEA